MPAANGPRSKISRKRRKEERCAGGGGSGSGSSSLEARSGGGRAAKEASTTSGFGDYSAAGEFEIWGEEHQYRLANGLDPVPPPQPAGGHQPSRGTLQSQQGVVGGQSNNQQQQQQQEQRDGGNSLRPLLHVAHCELHSPRDAELLRLDHLDSYEAQQQQQQQQKLQAAGLEPDRDAYAMMDNFHNPVPPPLPRRHVR